MRLMSEENETIIEWKLYCNVKHNMSMKIFLSQIFSSSIKYSLLPIQEDLDPVVQSIVSLTIWLRHKFVKQISAKVTNTLLFFVEKM